MSNAAPEGEERELYTLPDGSPRWLTAAEALDMGFCPACGAFVAGIDSEIPSISQWGMCSECVDELRAELGEFDGAERGQDSEDF